MTGTGRPPARAPRRFTGTLVAATLLALAGCASSTASNPSAATIDALIRAEASARDAAAAHSWALARTRLAALRALVAKDQASQLIEPVRAQAILDAIAVINAHLPVIVQTPTPSAIPTSGGEHGEGKARRKH